MSVPVDMSFFAFPAGLSRPIFSTSSDPPPPLFNASHVVCLETACANCFLSQKPSWRVQRGHPIGIDKVVDRGRESGSKTMWSCKWAILFRRREMIFFLAIDLRRDVTFPGGNAIKIRGTSKVCTYILFHRVKLVLFFSLSG